MCLLQQLVPITSPQAAPLGMITLRMLHAAPRRLFSRAAAGSGCVGPLLQCSTCETLGTTSARAHMRGQWTGVGSLGTAHPQLAVFKRPNA
jgi:hypothetical protein